MIKNCSTFAVYGNRDISPDIESSIKANGVQYINFPSVFDSNNLGSQIGEIVNKTSALLILNTDKRLHTVVQFFLAANKKVFVIDIKEDDKFLPKGINNFTNIENAIKELLNDNEKYIIESRIGKLEIRFNAFGLTYLKINEKGKPSQKLSKCAQKVQTQLFEYLDGKLKNFELNVFLKGTDFQKNVWYELCKIPYGKTISYGDLANMLGDNKASRAVGLANSKNPIWMVIPCHRVLSKEGELTGYAGGLKLKQILLDIESNQMRLF